MARIYRRSTPWSSRRRDLSAKGVMRFRDNPRLYAVYPRLACAAATELFRVGFLERPFAFRPATAKALEHLSAWRVFRDFWRARKL
jgi:hypothetical protein